MTPEQKEIRLGKKEAALVERIARRFATETISADVLLCIRRNVPMCVFDNYVTMRRELYIDGLQCASIDAELLESVVFNGGAWFPFFFNIGRWKKNRVYGDRKALPL